MLKTPEPIEREDIQGIVASGYDHLDFARYVFLEVTKASAAREWLKDIVYSVTKAVKPVQNKPPTCLNLAITWPGLLRLDVPEEVFSNFPYEFTHGMYRPDAASILGDREVSHEQEWEYGGSTHPLQLLAMLFANSATELDSLYQSICGPRALKGGLVVTITQDSVYERGDNTEPFGFRDGISQPNVKGLTAHGQWSENSVETGEFLLGYPNQFGQLTYIPGVNNWCDPSGYLAAHPQEPDNRRAFGLNGTYLVFRKLQQDVEGFCNFVNAHSPHVSGLNADQQRELFAAKMIGRWRSGAPLALYPDSPGCEPENKFLYMSEDPDGLRCPIGAHIRRTNPRDSLSMPPQRSLQSTARHRIIRRGRKYREPAKPFIAKNPQFERGLYFIALNANLRRQFEFIQQSWLNDPGFNGLDNDRDPIAGGNGGKGQFTIQGQPLNHRISGIQSFVTVRGGGYFFLPSIRALNFLAHWQG